jgi:hypothetical protein
MVAILSNVLSVVLMGTMTMAFLLLSFSLSLSRSRFCLRSVGIDSKSSNDDDGVDDDTTVSRGGAPISLYLPQMLLSCER